MKLLAIRRYPVKSMGGESLDVVELDGRGLVGDRRFAVVDSDGRFASGKDTRRFRRHDEVFGFGAVTSASGVFVTGHGHWKVGDPALDEALLTSFGTAVRVLPEGDVTHFDDGPVSLVGTASLEWCRTELGVDIDPRRLRVNLLVETTEPFVEETWSRVEVGEVSLEVAGRLTRCRMVDLAQDGLDQTARVLSALGPRDARLAVFCRVLTPGVIVLGAEVTGA